MVYLKTGGTFNFVVAWGVGMGSRLCDPLLRLILKGTELEAKMLRSQCKMYIPDVGLLLWTISLSVLQLE